MGNNLVKLDVPLHWIALTSTFLVRSEGSYHRSLWALALGSSGP